MNNRGFISYAKTQALKDISKWIFEDCGHTDSYLIGYYYLTPGIMLRDFGKEITKLNKELGI